MISDLFKIPCYETILSLDTKAISSYCLSYYKKNKGRVISNEGGYQSNDLTFSEKELKPLYQAILEHAQIFSKDMKYEGELCIDSLWFNINRYRDSNVLHSHNRHFLSGVYYVNAPKDSGQIIFYRPGKDSFESFWDENQIAYNPYNSVFWRVPPSSNTLLLFPSWLNHRVSPSNNKKDKRISISLNISFRSRLKDADFKTV